MTKHAGDAVGRIAAAGCFLPLTRDEDVDPNFGTRHRAAIGISQETDALAIAVSEETSAISLMVDGKVSRNLDGKELRRLLKDSLNTETDEPGESSGGMKLPWVDRIRSFFNKGGEG